MMLRIFVSFFPVPSCHEFFRKCTVLHEIHNPFRYSRLDQYIRGRLASQQYIFSDEFAGFPEFPVYKGCFPCHGYNQSAANLSSKSPVKA